MILSPSLFVDLLVASGWSRGDAEAATAEAVYRQRAAAVQALEDQRVLDVLEALSAREVDGT